MCSVIRVTTPADPPAPLSSESSGASGIWSESATRATRSRKSESPGRPDVGVGRVGGRADHRVVGELAGHGHELGEVLDPGLVLGILGVLELLEVATAGEHLLEHHVGPLACLHHLLELLDQVDEAVDGVERAARESGSVLGPLKRLPEGDPVARGQRIDAGLGPLTDAALGGVQHPPQRDGVGGVDQHPQVGERVADLAALVEPHAADDLVGHADADEDLLEDT